MKRNSRYNLIASTCEVNSAPSETVQGDAQSVYDLFQRMVLGQYTPSNLSFDDYDFSSLEGEVDLDSVDCNINKIGFTPEEAYQLKNHYSKVFDSELQEKTNSMPQIIDSELTNQSSDTVE